MVVDRDCNPGRGWWCIPRRSTPRAALWSPEGPDGPTVTLTGDVANATRAPVAVLTRGHRPPARRAFTVCADAGPAQVTVAPDVAVRRTHPVQLRAAIPVRPCD